MESSGDVLSTVDMVAQRRNGPRWLRELDDDDDELKLQLESSEITNANYSKLKHTAQLKSAWICVSCISFWLDLFRHWRPRPLIRKPRCASKNLPGIHNACLQVASGS